MCEKEENELKVAPKEMGQDKIQMRNGKESYSRPEKKTKVWIEGMFCLVMGVVCVPFLHSGRNV